MSEFSLVINFELIPKKKPVPKHIKEKKKKYHLKKTLSSTQEKLLDIYLSNNTNFNWNNLLNIYASTNTVRPSNALLHRELIKRGYSKIQTTHNQKQRFLWIKK